MSILTLSPIQPVRTKRQIACSSVTNRARNIAPKGQTVLKYTKNMIYIKGENPPESIGTSFLKIH